MSDQLNELEMLRARIADLERERRDLLESLKDTAELLAETRPYWEDHTSRYLADEVLRTANRVIETAEGKR